MASAPPPARALALLFIDLDHFKRVNDSLGHLVGDTVLQHAWRSASRGRCARPTCVARFGGDEFMVLLPDAPTAAWSRRRSAPELLAAIEAPVTVEGQRDLGHAVDRHRAVPARRRDAGRADQERRHRDVPRQGARPRQRTSSSTRRWRSAAYAALVLEGQLAQALERGEFVLHYQPQVRASDGRSSAPRR